MTPSTSKKLHPQQYWALDLKTIADIKEKQDDYMMVSEPRYRVVSEPREMRTEQVPVLLRKVGFDECYIRSLENLLTSLKRKGLTDVGINMYIKQKANDIDIPFINQIPSMIGKFSPRNETLSRKLQRERLEKWLFLRSGRMNSIQNNFVNFLLEETIALIQRSIALSNDKDVVHSLEDFCSRIDIWGGPGATSDKYTIPSGVTKNKYTLGLAQNSKDIYNKVKATVKGKRNKKLEIVTKPEAKKVRFIVLDDVYQHIIKSYLSQYFEKGLGKADPSLFPYLSKSSESYYMRRISEHLGDNYGIALDYSAWDEGLRKEYVTTVVQGIVKAISNFYNLDADIMNLPHVMYNYTVKGFEDMGYITNGLLSGSRWTTLINTIVHSLAVKYTINNYARDPKLGTDGTYFCNGDDMVGLSDHFDDFSNLKIGMTELGFTVNDLKSSISKEETDFLSTELRRRKTPTADPARILGSLLWSDSSEKGRNGEEVINSRLDNWAKFFGRFWTKYGRQPKKQAVIDDIFVTLKKYGLQLSKGEVRRFLSSPSQMGGGGIFWDDIPRYDKWLGLEFDKVTEKDEESYEWIKLVPYDIVSNSSVKKLQNLAGKSLNKVERIENAYFSSRDTTGLLLSKLQKSVTKFLHPWTQRWRLRSISKANYEHFLNLFYDNDLDLILESEDVLRYWEGRMTKRVFKDFIGARQVPVKMSRELVSKFSEVNASTIFHTYVLPNVLVSLPHRFGQTILDQRTTLYSMLSTESLSKCWLDSSLLTGLCF